MKIRLILVLLCCLFFIRLAESSEKVEIFDITDVKGDDYGAGNVIYPDNRHFRKGMYDITRFTVSKDKQNVYFRIEINEKIRFLNHEEFEYRYDLPEDFFLQLIQIYIDTDNIPNAGFVETIQGTNVKVDSASAWEYAVVITPIPGKFEAELKRKQDNLLSRVIIPRDVEIEKGKTAFLASMPISKIGNPQLNWGYTVLMLAHGFSGSWSDNIFVSEINGTSSQWDFGGGFARGCDPNVIDLITPATHSQESVLRRFDVDENKVATVYAVYGDKMETLEASSGKVTQISGDKIIVNLGSVNGIKAGTKLLVDNRMIAIVEEAFPEMCVATLNVAKKDIQADVGMKVTVFAR